MVELYTPFLPTYFDNLYFWLFVQDSKFHFLSELSEDQPFADEDKDHKKKMQMKEDLGVFVTMAVIVVLVKIDFQEFVFSKVVNADSF